ISKKWYNNHPGIPETERRLKAWLEDRLINWLPLISDATHNNLMNSIWKASCGKLNLSKPCQGESNLMNIIINLDSNGNVILTINKDNTTILYNPNALPLY